MAQIIDRKIDGGIEVGLKAGRQRIDGVAAVDQGPDVILVVVLPIPVDVLADEPGVERARQQRAERDYDRRQRLGSENRRCQARLAGLPASVPETSAASVTLVSFVSLG